VPDPSAAVPPARHAMRLLALEIERTVDGDVRGWLPVTDHLRSPSGGPRIAAVAMLVDALGGSRALPAADPDWAITADLSIHLLPTGPVSELASEVHIRRRGRRTIVLDFDLTGDDGIPAGTATGSFTVVARPAHLAGVTFDTTAPRRPMIDPPDDGSDQLTRSYVDELGIAEERPGVVAIELRPEVCNNLGALHGAVHTAMMDAASTSLGRQLLGPTAETSDVHLAFLELARPGPLRAEATAIGPPSAGGDRLSIEVRLLDADGRLCSYATTAVVTS
jgi:acyl-coenzyme A thioesterase PaaI-like protein